MIEKGEQLWLTLIIHVRSKRNDQQILSYYVLYINDWASVLLTPCEIKQSVNDWRSSFQKLFVFS